MTVRPNRRPISVSTGDFQGGLLENLYFHQGTTLESASAHDAYQALAFTVRDRLVDRRVRTAAAHYEANPRFVYYLSAEYLLGRQLEQNLLYSGTENLARRSVSELGLSLRGVGATGPRTGAGQRRPGAAGGLPARLARHHGYPGSRLRHPLRVRHLPADLPERRPGRAARRAGRSTTTRGSSGHPTTVSSSATTDTPSRSTTTAPACGAAGYPARRCAASPVTCWCPGTTPKR